MSKLSDNDFKFYIPLDVTKATDEQGNEIMKIGGIASTNEKDTDDEFLNPNGFDVSYFLKQGYFNWHHMAKNDPTAIIGEPTNAEIRPEGLYVEGILYPDNPIAQSVYKAAQMLEKNSSTRRLGFSIEGKALKRRSNDIKHPDYKYIEKAAITGCAVTFMPKNPKTYLDIIKGGVDEAEDEDYSEEDKEEIEKMLVAGSTTGTDTTDNQEQSGAPLKKEDVEDLKNLEFGTEKETKEREIKKSEGIGYILDRTTGINIIQAEKIFNTITMGKKGKVTEQDLNKGLDILNKALNDIDGGESNDSEKETNKTEENVVGEDSKEDEVEKAETNEASVENDSKDSEEDDEDESEDNDSDEDDVKKGLEDVKELILQKNQSVGLILKGMLDLIIKIDNRMDNFEKSIKLDLEKSEPTELKKGGTDSTESDIEKSVDVLGRLDSVLGRLEDIEKSLSMPNERKSTLSVRPRERVFQSNSGLEKSEVGGNIISKDDKKKVLAVLDEATFQKGFDSEFGEAMTRYENGSPLTQRIIARLATECGVIIK